MRGVALFLTVLTGFSGLVYEVTWEKYLATLLGSHSEATAAVLGLFLGGLALGYSLFGTLTRRLVDRARAAGRPPRLLFFYGFLEAGIGAYALVFPFLFQLAQALSFRIPHGSGGLGFALDVGLSALLIGPPAVLMGGTIPILTQALARSLADATRFHAFVYAFNTAGAFAGALAAGFWLVPALGLVGVLLAMGGINLFAGATFVALGLRTPRAPTGETDAERARVAVPGFAIFAAAALLVGFAMMTLQTALIRLGALSFGSSQFTFSMVVAVFVLCIALGSFAVSALPRIPRALLVVNLWSLLLLLFLLYRPLQDAPYWAHLLRSLFVDNPPAFYPYHLAAFLCVLVVIGLPVALSGATLPLIFHHLRREAGELGDVAGRIYSWNTVGSLLGALLGGYALLFWLDLHQVYRVAAAAVAVGAVLVTRRVAGIGSPTATAALLVPALLALAWLPAWSPDRLSSGPFRYREPTPSTADGPTAFFEHTQTTTVAFYTDDPTSSVAVREGHTSEGKLHRSILTNGKSDGTAPGEHVTMAFVSLLPALLAEKAERAFVIGFGTGVTAGEFAVLDSAREVVVAEISQGVIEAAPLFDFANQNASRNPKVRILRADAYRALLRSEGSFDVIASEPSNPWVTGVEMLFSREFLEAARDRLTPGGVFAQWFHVYETDAETVAMVLRTYASVFEHVAVWYAIGADLMLLGLPDPGTALDLDRLAARVRRPDFAAALRRCGMRGLPELLAHELLPVDVIDAESLPGELHTLLHPRLSHLAARAFYSGGLGALPPTLTPAAARRGAANSLVRRLSARRGGRLPEQARARLVTEACEYRGNECLTLLAQWAHEVPNSPARERLMAKIRQTPTLAKRTRLGLLEPLSRLYGNGGEIESRNALAAAKQASRHFSTYYHHAAPFSRELLAHLWRRCESEPSQQLQCLRARADAERTLGKL